MPGLLFSLGKWREATTSARDHRITHALLMMLPAKYLCLVIN